MADNKFTWTIELKVEVDNDVLVKDLILEKEDAIKFLEEVMDIKINSLEVNYQEGDKQGGCSNSARIEEIKKTGEIVRTDKNGIGVKFEESLKPDITTSA